MSEPLKTLVVHSGRGYGKARVQRKYLALWKLKNVLTLEKEDFDLDISNGVLTIPDAGGGLKFRLVQVEEG